MKKISDALRENIQGNPFLEFGLHHGLFNLTQLAHYLRPYIESRTSKQLTPAALTMALSRWQRATPSTVFRQTDYVVDKLTIHSRLQTATYPKMPDIHKYLNRLYERVHGEGGYCSLSQGQHEVTVIVDREYRLPSRKSVRPVFYHDNIAAIGVQFAPRYAEIPGMLYMILQRVALLNINLIEITSTFSEIHLFIDETDMQTVFDLLFQTFLSGTHSERSS